MVEPEFQNDPLLYGTRVMITPSCTAQARVIFKEIDPLYLGEHITPFSRNLSLY
jgi:hypothetical protein